MKCPVCPDVTLSMTNREGIEIDYCPNCRGVWLDRGELDKLIERSAAEAPARSPEPRQPAPDPHYAARDDRYRDERYGDDRYRDGRHRHKRKGLLGELFDFD